MPTHVGHTRDGGPAHDHEGRRRGGGGRPYNGSLGGSMRIGNKLGGATAWAAVVAALTALSAPAGAAERVQPVPLGGVTAEQTGDRGFGVYVPTRFGGVLTV